MSSGGLAKSKLDASYTSSKQPRAVALCLAESFRGNVQMIEGEPGSFIVTRINGYGVPMARWDIKPAANGSTIEFRHSLGIMVGKDKAENCF